MSQDNLCKLEAEAEMVGKDGNVVLDKKGKPKMVRFVYHTHKNKKKFRGPNARLQLKKYHPAAKKHVLFKETKK